MPFDFNQARFTGEHDGAHPVNHSARRFSFLHFVVFCIIVAPLGILAYYIFTGPK